MMMMTMEFKNQPFPASAPPRGRPPRREDPRETGSRGRPGSYAPLDLTSPR